VRPTGFTCKSGLSFALCRACVGLLHCLYMYILYMQLIAGLQFAAQAATVIRLSVDRKRQDHDMPSVNYEWLPRRHARILCTLDYILLERVHVDSVKRYCCW